LIAPGQRQTCSGATTDTSTPAIIFSICCASSEECGEGSYSARRRAGLVPIWPALLVSIPDYAFTTWLRGRKLAVFLHPSWRVLLELCYFDAMKKAPRKGLFQRPKGVWWINYYDALGGRHREKIGAYRDACGALDVRELEVREGSFVGVQARPPSARGRRLVPPATEAVRPGGSIKTCPLCGRPLSQK
jgi:hypothetical protein